uniref:Uncharacterized protein n=1 Tax=Neobodo designis TaxID=312471 RepID=A0A7S1QXM0_NEODS
MPQPKVVGDAAHSLVADLFTGPHASVIREAANLAISDRTKNSYRLAVLHVGGVSLKSFLAFVAAELRKPVRPDEVLQPGRGRNRVYRYATSTMRGIKSACSHMSFVTKIPWSSTESALAEQVLAGYEASNRSPTKRAALTVTMFAQYIAYVREHRLYDLEAGAEVMWACGLRPQDMHALCIDMCVLDDDGRVCRVYQKIKAPLHLAVRQGLLQLREISTERARRFLQARHDVWMQKGFDCFEPFFPGFTTAAVSEVFAILGRRHGWPQDVMFDGIHKKLVSPRLSHKQADHSKMFGERCVAAATLAHSFASRRVGNRSAPASLAPPSSSRRSASAKRAFQHDSMPKPDSRVITLSCVGLPRFLPHPATAGLKVSLQAHANGTTERNRG